MDRWVLLAALLGSAVLIACGMVFVLHDYLTPTFVNGAATARRIDTEIGDMIAARFPDVTVGTAQCPVVLNLTGRRRGRCTLAVSGTDLRIDLVKRYRGHAPELRDVDGLFVARDAERVVAAELAETHGEQFDVHCPGPSVRAIAADERVPCSVEAPDLLRRGFELRVSGHDGDVFAGSIGAVPTRADRTFGPDVAGRLDGDIAITGAQLERYVRGAAGAEGFGEVARRQLIEAVRCPARVMLHVGGGATCTVRIASRPLVFRVHNEKGFGLMIGSDKRIDVLAPMIEVAQRYFERPRFSGGKPLVAHITCDPSPVAFVEPGTSLPCTAKVADDDYPFAFQIRDPRGRFSIVGVRPRPVGE